MWVSRDWRIWWCFSQASTFQQFVHPRLDSVPSATGTYLQEIIKTRFPQPHALLLPPHEVLWLAVLCKATWPAVVRAPPACSWVHLELWPSTLGPLGKTDEKTKARSHAMPYKRADRIQILTFPEGLGRGKCGGPKLHPKSHSFFGTGCSRTHVLERGRHSCLC